MANRDEEAENALKLLFCAFFGLSVAAYLLSDVSGDHNCLRSYAEETIAGGMLGTFAIVMIVSLTWLVVAYGLHGHDVLSFLRRLIHVATAFVALLLCTSSLSYLQAEVPDGPSFWASALLFVVGMVFYVAATPVGAWVGTFLSARVNTMPCRGQFSLGLVVSHWWQKLRGPVTTWWRGMRNPVTSCARVALGYLGLAAIADATVLSGSDGAWGHPNVVLTYVVAWLALIFSLGVLVLTMRAMAPTAASQGR
jgi:hypothetical protein